MSGDAGDADAPTSCVVGSGAGGSVIAARAAPRPGKSVLVLEMGGYRNESDFNQLEIQGMQELYYGGGPGHVRGRLDRDPRRLDAGRRDRRQLHELHPHAGADRDEWAEHGLEGLDDYEAYKRDHIDAVMERLGANTEATQAERDAHAADGGARRAGPSSTARSCATRRWTTTPRSAATAPMGCQHGCKRSAMKTWLQDASDAGARRVVGCHAERILVEDGRATGVEAHGDPRGRLDHAR